MRRRVVSLRASATRSTLTHAQQSPTIARLDKRLRQKRMIVDLQCELLPRRPHKASEALRDDLSLDDEVRAVLGKVNHGAQ